MTMQQEEAVLSGVDPFAAAPHKRDVEDVWFEATPTSSRRIRPSAAPSAPAAPIGDHEADRWFR
jgi:hypothetical protein